MEIGTEQDYKWAYDLLDYYTTPSGMHWRGKRPMENDLRGWRAVLVNRGCSTEAGSKRLEWE